MAGVFNERQAALLAKSVNLGHATEVSAVVHNYYSFRTPRNTTFNVRRVYARFVQTHDVGEYWCCSYSDGHVGCRNEIDRRLNDLIPRSQPDSEVSQV